MPLYDLRERSKHLIIARTWGIGVFTVCLALGLFASEVNRILHLPTDLSDWMYLALFLVCIALVLVWIWCTQKEPDLLFEWMDPQRYEPPSDLKETAVIVGLSVLLVGLVFTARDPFAFGAVFTAYSTAIMLAVIHFNRELREVVSQSTRRLSEASNGASEPEQRSAAIRLEAIAILEEYFIIRPHTPRHIIILGISAIGLVVAITGTYFDVSVLRVIAYAIFILLILVSEAILAHWRNVRDHKLRPLTAELNEIRRCQERVHAAQPSQPAN